MSFNCKSLVPGSRAPALNNDGSYDLFSSENHIVKPQESITVSTGMAVSIPVGYHARVYSTRAAESNNVEVSNFCSINHHSHKYNTTNQTVWELKVILRNLGYVDYHIKKGTPIAKMVIHQIKRLPVFEVEELDDITQDFSVKMKMKNVKSFPGRSDTWFIMIYKENPEETKPKYCTDEMLEQLEDFKLTPEYERSKRKLDLEGKFLAKLIKKDEDMISKLRDDFGKAKAKSHII
jgi:dUTPase